MRAAAGRPARHKSRDLRQEWFPSVLETFAGTAPRALDLAGGVFLNADHMIDQTTPRINAAERAQRRARTDQARRNGILDRTEGWQPAAKDPVLVAPSARRHEIHGEHAGGDTRSARCPARAERGGVRPGRPVWVSSSDTCCRPGSSADERGRYGYPVPPPRRAWRQSTLDRNDFVRSCCGFVSTSRG
jgi:hypothetical protein